MAEILITLGIIGVVAAMTIPTLMHKINNKVLENQFKKSYANLQNAFRATVNDDISLYDESVNHSYDPEFGYQLSLRYRKSRHIPRNEANAYDNKVKNLFMKNISSRPACSQLFGHNVDNNASFELSDGSALSAMQNCGKLFITLDTNGLKNGPNALGYDVFIFSVGRNSSVLRGSTEDSEMKLNEDGSWSYNDTEETRDKCSLTSSSDINGATCAQFAIENKCPWDSSKTYWQCLP